MRALKKTIIYSSSILFLFISSFTVQKSQAQTIELLAGNALNGAMNGVMLGGATMALQNSSEFDPVRVGLGAGTLYGISVGVYDLSTIETGQQFYISGTFNDGTNTTVIVLLDTFYGAVSGAVIASSFSLIAKEPIVDALQYGSGVGAWAGFGFGLIDAFALANRPGSQQAGVHGNGQQTSGLLTYKTENKIEVGLLSPSLIQTKTIHTNSIESTVNPAVDILQLNIRL